jgi:dephospho-CoA kinase
MIKLAVTGNMGSGKSLMCRIFESLNIPVFYADDEAKQLYNEPVVSERIRHIFGDAVFENNELSKKKLADMVFSDESKLRTLEQIIHPLVAEKFQEWTEQQNTQCVIMENAVLFEGGFDKDVDVIILVTCPEKERIRRIQLRDVMTEEEIKKRMRLQWPEEKKREKADFIIVNDGNTEIVPQITEILSRWVD